MIFVFKGWLNLRIYFKSYAALLENRKLCRGKYFLWKRNRIGKFLLKEEVKENRQKLECCRELEHVAKRFSWRLPIPKASQFVYESSSSNKKQFSNLHTIYKKFSSFKSHFHSLENKSLQIKLLFFLHQT